VGLLGRCFRAELCRRNPAWGTARHEIHLDAEAFAKTPYLVVAVRLTLATNTVPGWNEIDAVQLVGDEAA
jgi:hypothetical protein